MSESQKWMTLVGTVLGGWLIYLLSPVLTPFAVAALLAYLGDPIADRLERVGLGRSAAVITVFTALVVVFVLVVLLLVPLLEQQVARLIELVPQLLTWVESTAAPWLRARLNFGGDLLDPQRVTEMLREHWREAGGVAATLLGSLSRSGMVVVGWITNLVLIPVVTFYLLRDWDVLVARIRELLPRRLEPTVSRLAAESNDVLGGFLRGQFSVMLSLGIVYASGLWLIGLDLALLIGMVAGLISFVPYLGTIVGVVAACIAALMQFQDVLHLVLVLAVFGAGQMLEGMVLTPWLVGDRIGLHPVAVIFAVLAGGQLFGLLGVLLALPVASVLMVLLRHVHEIYKESQLYRRAHSDGEEAASDAEA